MSEAAIDELIDGVDLRARVHKALSAFLERQQVLLDEVGPELAPYADIAAQFVLDGGKRLRPAFCYWGWRAGGGADDDEIVTAAASLELLQAGALVHDDLIDRSDTRRGQPSVHRRFASLHRASGWTGDAERFGATAALLFGDLCLTWADAMLTGSGLEPAALQRGRDVYDEMRTDLMAGQYLDLLEQVSGDTTVDRALRVARYKTARYTVEGPLRLGAAMAGAPRELLKAFRDYGLALGTAFQLRDDVLGVFGDPAATGKPAGDDLREGKRTTLIAFALERADNRQRDLVRRLLGDPALDEPGVDLLREVITETDALARVESLIVERTEEALCALRVAQLEANARAVLLSLAEAASSRSV